MSDLKKALQLLESIDNKLDQIILNTSETAKSVASIDEDTDYIFNIQQLLEKSPKD